MKAYRVHYNMKRTKKNKFSVRLLVNKLLNVPYTHGHFFTKIKLKRGDVTVAKTNRQEVSNNIVTWNETVDFTCRIYTDSSGLLIPCFLRISVRKEEKGGKSIEKLGVVNIDLAQFAVGGQVDKRYLLQADTKKQGKDNSVLQINISMTQTKGDHVYRTGSSVSASGNAIHATELNPKSGEDPNQVELAELDASLLSIQEATNHGSAILHALPVTDPDDWTNSRMYRACQTIVLYFI